MSNTSATGGYLSPTVLTPPEEDDDLAALLQAFVVGVTGLAGNLVRPRWQPVVPKLPDNTVDWCALGVRTQRSLGGAAIKHTATPPGSDTSERHEVLEIAFTFYGPHGRQFANVLRDGMGIPQNWEGLRAVGIKYRDELPIVAAPEQINNAWFKRYDYTVFVVRKTTRTYAIENLESAEAVLLSDTTPKIVRPIHVHPAP